eukprot:GHVS01037731.1.p1 GENE.GHVS01037731.1~~GHVS01037731.1.p1  ORF type:complete len:111 (-),score=40.39 GHVS01037731.1:241-573(-)
MSTSSSPPSSSLLASSSGWAPGTREFDRLVTLLSSYHYGGNNTTTLEMAKALVKVQLSYEQTEEVIKSLENDYLQKSNAVAQQPVGPEGGGVNLLRAWAQCRNLDEGKSQ